MPVTPRGTRWQASVCHKHQRYRRDFPDRQQALQWEADAKAALLRGEAPPGTPQGRASDGAPSNLQALFDLTYRTVWAGSKAERTAERNGQDVVNLIGPNTRLSEISDSTIDALICKLEDSGIANSTINRKLAALSKMLTLADRRGYLTRRPHILRKREPQGRIRWLTQEEEAKLIDTMKHFGKPDFADLVVFLVDTGMRLSEALNVPWKDIDKWKNEGWVRLWDSADTSVKNGEARSIPLTARALEMLRARCPEICLPEDGPFTMLPMRTFHEFWTRCKSHMGLGQDEQFVPHALRHTYISRLIQAGVDLPTVQKLAGHKTIQMTLRYAHLAPRNLKVAADVLDKLAASRHAVQPAVGVMPQ